MGIEAGLKANIHNRFDFHIEDIVTGERTTLTGYNTVLNKIWTYLCNDTGWFNEIHIGTGTGELNKERTTLFNRIGSKPIQLHEEVQTFPVSHRTCFIVLNPTDYVGQTITEVGIGQSATADSLATHAFLADAEGATISLPKTDTMIVTIYATVFAEIINDYGEDLHVHIPGSSTNRFIGLLLGGSMGSATYKVGAYPGRRHAIGAPSAGVYLETASSSSASGSADIPNKRRVFPARRFEAGSANGHIAEFGVDRIFTARFPLSGVYAGHDHVDIELGIGNDAQTVFPIPSHNVDLDSLVVKVNGVATSGFTTAQRLSGDLTGTTNILTTYPFIAENSGLLSCNAGEGLAIIARTAQAGVSANALFYMRGVQADRIGELRLLLDNVFGVNGRVGQITYSNGYLFVTGGVENWNVLEPQLQMRWFKLVDDGTDIILTELDTPADFPYTTYSAVQPKIAAWDNFFFIGVGRTTSPVESWFMWYEIVADELIKQTNPATVYYPSGIFGPKMRAHSGKLVIQPQGAVEARIYLIDDSGANPVLTYVSGSGRLVEAYIDPSPDGHLWVMSNALYYWNGSTFVEGALLGASNYAGWISPRVRLYPFSSTGNSRSRVLYNETGQAVSSAGISSGNFGERFVIPLGANEAYCQPHYMVRVDNITDVVLDTPAPSTEVVTASYTVNGIHKTSGHMLDLAFYVEFGEPAP